jgi:hypothetical protein
VAVAVLTQTQANNPPPSGYGKITSGNAGSSPSYDFGSSNDDNDNDPPPVVYTPPPVVYTPPDPVYTDPVTVSNRYL